MQTAFYENDDRYSFNPESARLSRKQIRLDVHCCRRTMWTLCMCTYEIIQHYNNTILHCTRGNFALKDTVSCFESFVFNFAGSDTLDN